MGIITCATRHLDLGLQAGRGVGEDVCRVRGQTDDHGQIYNTLVSGKGLYGNIPEEIAQSTSPPLDQGAFRGALQKLFGELRASGRWDYVLVDTRGGFGYTTECAVASTVAHDSHQMIVVGTNRDDMAADRQSKRLCDDKVNRAACQEGWKCRSCMCDRVYQKQTEACSHWLCTLPRVLGRLHGITG